MMNDRKKQLGQVFTPDWVVKLILDGVGYRGDAVPDKFIFEPGSGDGNFLHRIVERYIAAARARGDSAAKIKRGLEKHIYGAELDAEYFARCIARLNALAETRGIKNVCWNIHNADIMDLDLARLPAFDFIVGNPPYVRIHNLQKDYARRIKSKFAFCRNGIIDLFLVFFEAGIKSLAESGRLGYITPNSYIHNSTYVPFRQYLADNRLIKKIIDFKDHQIFEDASTYSAVTLLDRRHNSSRIAYAEYGSGKISPVNNIDLAAQDVKKWNLTSAAGMRMLSRIKSSRQKIADCATVQYGFATLLDRAYILPHAEQSLVPFCAREKAVLYPVVKGSKYSGEAVKDRIIYPYRRQNSVWTAIPEDELQRRYPQTYRHLLANKAALLKRDCDKSVKFWYEYGRSQGIQSIHHEKLVISPICKNEVRVFPVRKDTMVYSGIYLFLKEDSGYTLEDLAAIIRSAKFRQYVQIVGKDMRGGYKTVNTKAIREYGL